MPSNLRTIILFKQAISYPQDLIIKIPHAGGIVDCFYIPCS
jgi:hypothetical protein